MQGSCQEQDGNVGCCINIWFHQHAKQLPRRAQACRVMTPKEINIFSSYILASLAHGSKVPQHFLQWGQALSGSPRKFTNVEPNIRPQAVLELSSTCPICSILVLVCLCSEEDNPFALGALSPGHILAATAMPLSAEDESESDDSSDDSSSLSSASVTI